MEDVLDLVAIPESVIEPVELGVRDSFEDAEVV